jgi:hypothetical protein
MLNDAAGCSGLYAACCRRVFYAFDYEMSINGGGDAGGPGAAGSAAACPACNKEPHCNCCGAVAEHKCCM